LRRAHHVLQIGWLELVGTLTLLPTLRNYVGSQSFGANSNDRRNRIPARQCIRPVSSLRCSRRIARYSGGTVRLRLLARPRHFGPSRKTPRFRSSSAIFQRQRSSGRNSARSSTASMRCQCERSHGAPAREIDRGVRATAQLASHAGKVAKMSRENCPPSGWRFLVQAARLIVGSAGAAMPSGFVLALGASSPRTLAQRRRPSCGKLGRPPRGSSARRNHIGFFLVAEQGVRHRRLVWSARSRVTSAARACKRGVYQARTV